jgi:hypothetical protein
MYIDIVNQLRRAVRRKRPEKWGTNNWFLLRDNALAHGSVLVLGFLAKNNMTTLEHIRYSPDLAAADIYMIPRPKSALKGRNICDTTNTTKNATEELKMLSHWLPVMFPTIL